LSTTTYHLILETFSKWKLIYISKNKELFELRVIIDKKLIAVKRILTKTNTKSIQEFYSKWKSQVLDRKVNNEKKLVGAKRIANQLSSTTHQLFLDVLAKWRSCVFFDNYQIYIEDRNKIFLIVRLY
jgi:hypothetical protein